MNAVEHPAVEHPAPWWFRLANRYFPARCREIPEAQNPDRIVLRQVALFKRYVYLQQFAGPEDSRYMHSHQWHRTIAIGLWGGYTEQRIAGPARRRTAPYFYTMDSSVVHHVQSVTPGHTSIFIGLWRDDDLKHYYGAPALTEGHYSVDVFTGEFTALMPQTFRTLWSNHIKKMVARI